MTSRTNMSRNFRAPSMIETIIKSRAFIKRVSMRSIVVKLEETNDGTRIRLIRISNASKSKIIGNERVKVRSDAK